MDESGDGKKGWRLSQRKEVMSREDKELQMMEFKNKKRWEVNCGISGGGTVSDVHPFPSSLDEESHPK